MSRVALSVYADLTPVPCLGPCPSAVPQSPSVSCHVLTHGDSFLRRGTRSEVRPRRSARQPLLHISRQVTQERSVRGGWRKTKERPQWVLVRSVVVSEYHLGKNDHRNACCRFNFFELIKTVMTVIQCGSFFLN